MVAESTYPDTKSSAGQGTDEKHFAVDSMGLDQENGEVHDITDVELAERKLVRQGLHQRHIQMIALAGTIGTGLFLSSG